MATEIVSGQAVFLSLSFIWWRRECIVSFLSAITFRKRFIIMAEALFMPHGWAYLGKNSASGSLSLIKGQMSACASGESGTERF